MAEYVVTNDASSTKARSRPTKFIMSNSRMSFAVALSTVRFGSVPPQFRGRILCGWGQGPPTYLSLPPSSRENLRLDGYLEYPPATKTLYFYKYPCLLRDVNPVPTAQ
ncbi:hypothetical protein TNCV_1708911 [Trichonephila clavipes]|nr:hypothetical protein TNCV_1708911 [Trichonephila clavipes]